MEPALGSVTLTMSGATSRGARGAAGWGGPTGPAPSVLLGPHAGAGSRCLGRRLPAAWRTWPATSFGNAGSLQVDNSPVKHILLKFDLSSLGGQTIVGARLRLNVVDSSSSGGSFHRAAGNLWSEATVTWNNAPATDGSVAPVVVGSVSAGTTIEVDVTSLLSGNVLSLRVTSPSSNGADYSSKEGAAPPQLAVTVQ